MSGIRSRSPHLARLFTNALVTVWAIAWAAVLPAVLPPVAAEEARPKAAEGEDDSPEFVRTTHDRLGQLEALETAIVRYTPAVDPQDGKGVEVDLVAAIHVGSAGYYDSLDAMFKDYDRVLYELVAPDNARVPRPGRRPTGAIGQAQQGLTSVLGLEFQLDRIDYAAANFVHADLSPKEFDAAMERRGESWWTMFGRLMEESLKSRNPAGGEVSFGDLFGALFGRNREVRLRRIMAAQFTDMEVLTAAFGGEEGSTLITDRNAAAIDVLEEEIDRGARRIAIFYGAAHMPDFDRRLREKFGLVPTRTRWVEAWDLRMPKGR